MMQPAVSPPLAQLQRANMLLSAGRLEDAIHAYDACLTSQPNSGEAWHNRGIALARTRRFAHAAQSFGRALALYPESAASWHNRGLAFAELGEFHQAIRDHARALSLNPQLPGVVGDLVLAKLNCCEWQDLEIERRRISGIVDRGRTKRDHVLVRRHRPEFENVQHGQLLAELARPGSATTLAGRVGLSRQRINYHLRTLEAHGLVRLVREQRRRGLTERVMQASAAAYVVSPGALGPL